MNMSRMSRLGVSALVVGALVVTSMKVIIAADDSEHRGLPLSAPNGIITSNITPVTIASQTSAMQGGVCGTLNLHGTVALDQHQTLLTNKVSPEKVIVPGGAVRDDTGTTVFTGNVALMPCNQGMIGNANVTLQRILEVNDISAVTTQNLQKNGSNVLDPCTKKPVMVCVPDRSGITNFRSDVGVYPNQMLLVNNIAAGSLLKDPSTGCQSVITNTDTAASINFNSNIQIQDQYMGQISDVIIPHCNLCYSPLAFTFSESGETRGAGAIAQLTFVGTSSHNDDIAWLGTVYVAPNNDCDGVQIVEAPNVFSCSNNNPPLITLSQVVTTTNNTNVVLLKMCVTSTNSTSYSGTLSYNIQASSNLLSVGYPNQALACVG